MSFNISVCETSCSSESVSVHKIFCNWIANIPRHATRRAKLYTLCNWFAHFPRWLSGARARNNCWCAFLHFCIIYFFTFDIFYCTAYICIFLHCKRVAHVRTTIFGVHFCITLLNWRKTNTCLHWYISCWHIRNNFPFADEVSIVSIVAIIVIIVVLVKIPSS